MFFTLFLIVIINSTEYTTHQLKGGETLWKISKLYNVKLEDICSFNNIDDVTKVKEGFIIKIPLSSKSPEDQNNSNAAYKIHVLKDKETLWRVSKIYNIKVDEICKINNISDITKVKSGTILKIPVKIKYLDYYLPINGKVKKFNTSHFEGINIITGENKEDRIVYAVDDGEITYLDKVPGYGLTVFIRHKSGLVSTYSCFEEIYVKKNSKIVKGQKIGIAGNLIRNNEFGIIYSIQDKGSYLKFDFSVNKFILK
jgi:LysM repeat protein